MWNFPLGSTADLPEPNLPENVKRSFEQAHANIAAFHLKQKDWLLAEGNDVTHTTDGVCCYRVSRPVDTVGLYVPGGTAILPSTALMLTTPATVAGCPEIVLATPPGPNGSVCDEVVYAAKIAGATKLLCAGGAQAIAAMGYGTESVPKAQKIFGPGNQYVTTAKMAMQGSESLTAIDMPAGPSEVLVIADGGAPPEHVAIDLLSQAEHGPDSQVVLAATPALDVDAVASTLEKQLDQLPRGEIAREAIDKSVCVLCESIEDAIDFSNKYAPEHLIINCENADKFVEQVRSAGSVFLGRLAPESVGDYASGTNHVLPTYGYAHMYSGVSVDSFMKRITVQSLTKQGLQSIGPHVTTMARQEGLEAHARAVDMRLEGQSAGNNGR